MAHKKLKRFAAIATYPNVFQYPEGMQGKWGNTFKNENTITLELACGKGEYTIALAEKYPSKNFIGIDLKGNRIWKGATYALQHNLTNALFLRTQIEKIANYFAPGEVDEIWITFPDPQLQLSRAKKRLVHPRFLKEYQHILRSNGVIHLKTDSPDLYQFAKKVIGWCRLTTVADIPNIYAQQSIPEDLHIKTYYESLDISGSRQVFYISFCMPQKWNDDISAFDKWYKETETAIGQQ